MDHHHLHVFNLTMGTTGDKEADYLSSLKLGELALQNSVGKGFQKPQMIVKEIRMVANKLSKVIMKP